MKKILIGRKEEQQKLLEALQSSQPEFLAIIGRRRIGKTYLVKQTFVQEIDFELTGLQHAKKAEQLLNFTFAFRTWFPDFEFNAKPKSWLEAFHLLSQGLKMKAKQGKMVVFLDELPWLGSKRSEFIRGLGWFWNSWAVNQKIVLVVCGSAASWMIEKVVNDRGGLHNRITKLLFLHPFTLGETAAFLQSRKIKLNQYQIAQIYMTMGGVPMYLDQLKPGLSAVQNIQEICFHRNGYLRLEFDRLFASLFDNAENHIQIIQILATKKMGMTRQEIIDKGHFSNGGMLTALLKELQQSGFLEIYNGYGKKSRQSLYRLSDPYTLFYLTFLAHLGNNAHADFNKLSDLPNYKSWSGYAFENLCLLHIPQIKKALGISGIYSTIATFFSKPKDKLPGTQIDLIIDRNDQSINICEIKFSNSSYEWTKKDVENLETKKMVFQHHTKTGKHLFSTIISTFPLFDNTHKLNHVDQVVILEDLFALL